MAYGKVVKDSIKRPETHGSKHTSVRKSEGAYGGKGTDHATESPLNGDGNGSKVVK